MVFGVPEKKIDAASNRRIAPRQKACAEVWADPGGTSLSIPCRIIDISQTGAKLATDENVRLPDEFTLVTAGAKYPAHVVWRRMNKVGVEFVPAQD